MQNVFDRKSAFVYLYGRLCEGVQAYGSSLSGSSSTPNPLLKIYIYTALCLCIKCNMMRITNSVHHIRAPKHKTDVVDTMPHSRELGSHVLNGSCVYINRMVATKHRSYAFPHYAVELWRHVQLKSHETDIRHAVEHIPFLYLAEFSCYPLRYGRHR